MVTKLAKHYLTSSEFVDLQISQTSLDSIHQILSIATQLPSDITFNKLTNLIQQIDQSYSTNWPITFNKLTNHIQQIDQSHSTNWPITFTKLINYIQQIDQSYLTNWPITFNKSTTIYLSQAHLGLLACYTDILRCERVRPLLVTRISTVC